MVGLCYVSQEIRRNKYDQCLFSDVVAYAAALEGVYSCSGLCCMPSRGRLGAVVICVLSGLWRTQGVLSELGRAKVMQVALDTGFWSGRVYGQVQYTAVQEQGHFYVCA